jgi:hypothetical protein
MTESFSLWRLKTEVILRGKWITESATIEFLLTKIIIYCNAKKPSIVRKFNKTKFWEKISWVKKDLASAHPNLFKKLKKSLNKIDKLKEIRNEMAHHSFMFDINEKDKSFIEVRDIVYKNGKNQMAVTTYKLEYLEKKYREFKDAGKEMVNIWIQIVNDFNKNDPSFKTLSTI